MPSIQCQHCGERVAIGPGLKCRSCGKSFRQSTVESAADAIVHELAIRREEKRAPVSEADLKTIARSMGVDARELRSSLIDRGVQFTTGLPSVISLGTAEPPSSEPKSDRSVTCSNCEREFNEEFTFCPSCGSEVEKDPWQIVQTRIARLEADVEKLQGLSSWRWFDIEESERWKVWWGVWWRGVLIALAFYGLLYVLVIAGT